MSIEIKNVGYTYMKGTPFERRALQNINITIEKGSFTAIAGHTGSGKSTLVQLMAGLLPLDGGQLLVDGADLGDHSRQGKQAAKAARRKVGLVFQYPEHQLFEETVEKDISFGPRNLGMGEAEIKARVKNAMKLTGLDYETKKNEDPFRLSGGQKRRAAIAGVIAMGPKYLILDEPAAGLDPMGREKILNEIKNLHAGGRMTIILVSHNMDDIARFADKVIVMHQGECLLEDSPEVVFRQKEKLNIAGLQPPRITMLLETLKSQGLEVPALAIRMEQGVEEILRAVNKEKLMLEKGEWTCFRI